MYKAILFDLQGTLTDFMTSLVDHGTSILGNRVEPRRWEELVHQWRVGYREALEADVAAGTWTSVRGVYRRCLVELLDRENLAGAISPGDVDELTLGWERLRPWPDASPGLRRLREQFLVAPLSNADLAAVVGISKTCGFDWDAVFSAQLFGAFKPAKETYLGAVALLGVRPDETIMVASHAYDLLAAHECGLATAFVSRPCELGTRPNTEAGPDDRFDINVDSIVELAEALR